MIQTVRHLGAAGLPPAVCVGVHAIFAQNAHEELLAAGAAAVVTCNTVPHASNAIDVNDPIARATRGLL